MNRFLTFAIFLICFLAIFVISKQPAGWRRELEKRDEKYQGQIDSLNALIEVTRAQDALMVKRIAILKDSLTISLRSTKRYEKKYLDLKNAPVKKYSDSQIDSLLAHWYGYRRDN